jgi:(p)ppGpp synthase/HD superfamily hydrolase
MATLEHAIALAAKAHAGQIDKAGLPYILHPLRMMLRLNENDDRIVAVLHDVVEDCGWTLEDLRAEGFATQIIEAVEAVTRRADETYEQFVERAALNSIGKRVKLADLLDNSDMSRIAQPTQKDFDRIERYRHAIEKLQDISL